MRRVLLGILLLVLIAIVMSLVFQNHQGYLLLSFNGWQIQTSVLVACIALVVFIVVLAIVWRIFTALVFAPGHIRGYARRRRQRKALRLFQRGLEAWAEARWARAEKSLKKLDKSKEAAGLGYLFAARAAQQRGHIIERDQYLEKAAGDRSVSELAVLATQAELQTAAGQTSEAESTLARLYRSNPRHPWGLAMYGEQLLASGQYERLYKLLTKLKKHAFLKADRLAAMSFAAYSHRLSSQKDLGGLTSAWRRLPEAQRGKPELVHQYALCLQKLKAHDEAANVIRKTIKNQWDTRLVLLFGNLQCSDQTKQLATVEEWINAYGNKPELMLVAGWLCLRNQLWGRARNYFESSQVDHPRVEGLFELGRVYEHINEPDQARKTYRKPLEQQHHVSK
jgi:HemY protein